MKITDELEKQIDLIGEEKQDIISSGFKGTMEKYQKLSWIKKLFYKFPTFQDYSNSYFIIKIAELELKIKQLEYEQNK